MRIGIDIDDTLTNTKEIQITYWKEYHHKYPNEEYTDNLPDNINVFGYPYIQQFWDIYREELSFNCSFKKNAGEVLKLLKNDGHTLCIITSRPDSKYKDLRNRLDKWFKDNNIYYDELYTDARYKGKVAKKEKIDIIIDDCDYHLDEAAKYGIKGILFSNQKSNKYPTVDNWLNLYDIIKKIEG